ncbi:DUF3634 family protein [Ectothiorhodospira sp. BSL-9]|uniref:DUF3634 family protein n=1 Tax=Ectothiorhodospira sp. BSL-9 TaxID=1442136 RepID=UPI0007B45204|nr:DUF3634 family protein [Ectothiorhodospira sp. BSL-9]ANB02551.1 hypothetical protein ECTOBSL9_1980 [Ectothiorhodospira sp. BSL-9]TVQ74701.1 MAG: DUF3634 family protein [Chromatiaceae bacterium]
MLMPLLLMFAILALGAGLLIWHARIAFVVKLQDGKAQAQRGTPPPDFLRGCGDVARMYGIKQGRIRGIRSGQGIRLSFSRDIPEHTHQPFRNVWTPPPGGNGGGGRRAAG